jgi:hypothetical protein
MATLQHAVFRHEPNPSSNTPILAISPAIRYRDKEAYDRRYASSCSRLTKKYVQHTA